MRVAETDALAMAFGIPMPALWYLPVAGEPWSLAQMRERLQEIEERIEEQEKATRSMVGIWADYQFERERIARAMNDAAKKAERGELEEMNLNAAELDALIEGMDPERSRGILAKMTDEELERAAAQLGISLEEAKDRRKDGVQRANLHLHLIESGEPQQIASEAWRRYLAGESLQVIAQALAESLPSETFASLRSALDVIGEALKELGVSAPGQATATTMYLTVAEAAGILHVPEPEVERLIRSGELPAIQVGGSSQVPADAVSKRLSVTRSRQDND